MDLRDRYEGTLLGLAVGDALGTALEFRQPGSFAPIADMIGGGPFDLEPGQWTDDTSMTLCIAASLIACRAFDPVDQLRRYCRWYREGYFSSTSRCFDIGNTTRGALERFERTGEPFPGSTDPRSAGNGSLMRVAPVPLFFAHDARSAIVMAGESSRTTHGAREAVDACRYFGGLLIGALQGRPKAEILAPRFSPVPGLWNTLPLAESIAIVADGAFVQKEPPAIRGTGYVVDCLEAALWAFHRSTSFADGALLAVNLGDDADTTGAVYGQIAGAYYGAPAIPISWRTKVVHSDWIEGAANQLLRHCQESARRKNG